MLLQTSAPRLIARLGASARPVLSKALPSHPPRCTCARCVSATTTFPLPPIRPFSLLAPRPSATPSVVAGTQRGMKVRSAIKKYCNSCSFVKRQGTMFVICDKDPKHKQCDDAPTALDTAFKRQPTPRPKLQSTFLPDQMNVVKEIQSINLRELASGSKASWHDQYKDSAYVYAGGLHPKLTEGDIITIFSQYGEVVDISLPRDATTQKPKGFAFLMYADQRSTVLAVDNLGGAKVLERTLRVDHVLNYKSLEVGEDGKMREKEGESLAAHPDRFKHLRANEEEVEEEVQSDDSEHNSIDLDDPMRDYLIRESRAAKKLLGPGGLRGKKDKDKKGKGKKGRGEESKEERQSRREAKKLRLGIPLEKEHHKRSSGVKKEGASAGGERREGGDRPRAADHFDETGPERGGRRSRSPDEGGRDRERRRDDERRSDRDDVRRGTRDDDRRGGRDDERRQGRNDGEKRSSNFDDLEKWARR